MVASQAILGFWPGVLAVQIQIPDEIVPEIARRAKAAGCVDVEQYILTLVSPNFAADHNSTRIAQAIDQGFDSGVSETPLAEFLMQIRRRLTAAGDETS